MPERQRDHTFNSRKSRDKASPARLAALAALQEIREKDAYAQDVLERSVDVSHMSSEDRAFATKIVLGVVSTSGTLDELLNQLLDKPEQVSPRVLDALRISTYELLFLDKSPHAAVDQGVELVRSVTPAAAGLANAVLRKVARVRSAFPFGDPRTDLQALSRLYAFPVWLTKLLIADLGLSEAMEFMRLSNEQAPLFVGVNTVRCSDTVLQNTFHRLDETIDQVYYNDSPIPGCFRVADTRALLLRGVKRMLSSGRIVVSDAASQLVASSVLGDVEPQSFLEIGAGRATKTILLQSDAVRRYGHQLPHYITLDNRYFKTKILRERIGEYGIEVKETLTGDALKLGEIFTDERFDVIFIDAPCSGLGTLRRHPEIRWKITPQDISTYASTQLEMLKSAAPFVAAQGSLVYATCTVTHAENNGVVKAFLESDAGKEFTLAPINGASCIATRLTQGSMDAHFAVRFVKRG
ncbi:transcription antitermination factor NusB [Eggerthellaceae bacterium 3-80]|nr:antitermination protein NusB [bacterium D16-34]